MNNRSENRKKWRNLSLCPIKPDSAEILDLISDLKKYLKGIDFQNDSIYGAYYVFDYDGTTYRMDEYALSSSPAKLFKARPYIIEKLDQLGAENIHFCDRED